MTTLELLKQAKAAAPTLGAATTEQKNRALQEMANQLESQWEAILQANAMDLCRAKDTISPVMQDRLRLDESRIQAMAEGIRQVMALPDPVGRVRQETKRPNGMTISKVGVPMGVVAIIYESRPNVTADAAALAIKSGNACVLRCGKEAFHSAGAIVTALRAGLQAAELPTELVSLVQDTSRESARELMTAVGLVDLLIPRGGAGLIRACTENAKVPCIQTGTGICHIYVDKDADLNMALNILENAKTSRPSVLRLCPLAARFIPGKPAAEADFDTEFLDYILAVKVVPDTREAIAHIAAHSTGHSEAIITANPSAADLFTRQVDSAAVYVNCSTRFTDGGEFGLGCEMGISTQKLHARGPMGLEELCTYKYVISGNGQTR